jgi:cell division septation protein DedD
MSDADPARPALRQLLWIAAGVAVLTLLVVAASWLFSPRRLPGESAGERNTAPLVEEQVQKETFAPESASARSPQVAEGHLQPSSGSTSGVEDLPSSDAPSAEPLVSSPPSPPPVPHQAAPKAQAPSSTRSASSEPPAPTKGYAVQVGAFSEEAKAREIANRLKGLGYSASVLAKEGRYKVLAKGFTDRSEAEKAQADLARAGIKDPFIVPVE